MGGEVIEASVPARRWRAVVDHGRDAFVEVDGDFVVTEWNRRASLLLGWTPEEIRGRTAFDIMGPKFVGVVEQGLEVLRAMAEGQGAPGAIDPLVLEMELCHRDGSPLVATGNVFATGTGGDLRVGCFLYDATSEPPQLAREPERERLHDPLTGLPGRALFARRVGVAIRNLERYGGSVAVAVLGLDRFKAINDTLGHDAGDDLLVAVAARLRHAGGGVRPVLARLGGDGFLALFEAEGSGARAEAELFAQRALASLLEPFDIGGAEIFVSASLGIALADSAETPAAHLLSNADAAMHRAKAAGGSSHVVFGAAMRRQVVEKMTTEHSLHRAINRRELSLFYQPVVDISRPDSAPVSAPAAEALVRWNHPQRGLVVPDRFIPVAEESGLIIPIGTWVLEEACRQLDRWRRDGSIGPFGSVEVNLSARQVDHPELVATVERVLSVAGLPPENLTLEITESALMRDAVTALEVLRALKTIGVSLAIDDFGTGYSSLSYLQRFPLDILKVDKSFVDELDRAQGVEIVAAVVNLAHALGLKVVAEGVESAAQLAALQELGCDFAQGYLFSEPVPAAQLVRTFAVGG